MKVDGVHEKFIHHPKNLACCCQIQVHRYLGSRKVRCVEVMPSVAENFSVKSTWPVKDGTSAAISSPVAPAT
jgi:hypothetical protein